MSLLEQLAKQAESRKPVDTSASPDREAQFNLMTATFEKFKDYLSQLTTLLAQHPEPVVQQYELAGYGPLQAQLLHDYSVKFTPTKNQLELVVLVNAQIAADSPAVIVQGVSKIQTIKAFFDKFKVVAIQDVKKDASNMVNQATFKPRGKIALSLVCTTDAANPTQMKMVITNFEDLGQSTKQFQQEQMDEQFFDLVGHYIARKDNELTKEKLPDGVLRKLRHTAQQNEMRRRWEEKLANQAAAEEEARLEAERQKNLGSKMYETGKSLVGKLTSFMKKKE